MQMIRRKNLQELHSFTRGLDLTSPKLFKDLYEAKSSLNFFKWNYKDQILGNRDVEDSVLRAVNVISNSNYVYAD